MADTRIVKPFITDADDIYSFDSVSKMKSEIKAILGFDLKKIIRVNRFKESDHKGRLHWRILSDTNDGSGIEVEVNLSNNPKVPNIVTKYANLVKGACFLDNSSRLSYWTGSEYAIVPKESAVPKVLQDPNDAQVINWKRVPVIIEAESDLLAEDQIHDGDLFILASKPTTTNGGDFYLYFATTKDATHFPNNSEIPCGTTGIHVFKIAPSGTATTKGTFNATTNKIEMPTDKIVLSDMIIKLQELLLNTNQLTTDINDKSANKIHAASVTGLAIEKAEAAAKLAKNSGVITFIDENGVEATYYATKRTIIRKKVFYTEIENDEKITIDIPAIPGEDYSIFERIQTWNVDVRCHYNDNIDSLHTGFITNNITTHLNYNDRHKIDIIGLKQTVSYHGSINDTYFTLFIDILHGYKRQP